MRILTQTINLFALIVSGFAAGYAVGVNPSVPCAAVAETSETFTAVVSAYCQCERCCAGSADGITASGHRLRPGDRLVAADKRFAFGTEMVIPGYNEGRPVKVLDRGSKIKGDKLDVYFDDDPKMGKSGHQRAIEWGVRNLIVKVER